MGDRVVPIRGRYEAGFDSDYNQTPPAGGSADAEIYRAGDRLRQWARYLAKNAAPVIATLDARQTKGVGPGLTYQPMVRDRKGKPIKELNDAIANQHARWSESADVTGELSRQEVERLAWRDWDCAGEMFGRKVYRGRNPQRVGYQVQLIRSELVPYGFFESGTARMGIERDQWGAPTRYAVYPYAPNSDLWRFGLPEFEPQWIPAREIVHLRRQKETDATRGITLFHGVIFRVSDIAKYQESHRRAARATANLFAGITRGQDYDPENQNPPEVAGSYQHELDLSDLQVIDYLKKGEGLEFYAPQHPNQNATEFVNQELRQFASACRVAFSWIAYVFDRAYAAQRVENVHAWEMIYEDRAQFVRDFAKPLLYVEPLKLMMAEGKLPARLLRRADPMTLYDVRIDGPAMPSIDPEADRKTAEMDQRNGWDSRQGVARRFGKDPRQVDAERDDDDRLAELTAAKQPAPLPAAENTEETNDDDNGED